MPLPDRVGGSTASAAKREQKRAMKWRSAQEALTLLIPEWVQPQHHETWGKHSTVPTLETLSAMGLLETAMVRGTVNPALELWPFWRPVNPSFGWKRIREDPRWLELRKATEVAWTLAQSP